MDCMCILNLCSYGDEIMNIVRELIQNKLISVIVPVYNCEKYLSECIDSILNQTYSNLEIILVDDRSTDNSGSICDEYARQDMRVHVYHQQNQGVSAARNYGLKMARGGTSPPSIVMTGWI